MTDLSAALSLVIFQPGGNNCSKIPMHSSSLGGPSCQWNWKDRRIVPDHYNQSDLLNGEFVSCAFTNCPDTHCTQADVTLVPGKYFKQSSNQICSVWQHGKSACFTMIGAEMNLTVKGATLHRKNQ